MSNNSIITAVGGPLDVTAKIIATGPRGQDGDVTREEFAAHLAEKTTRINLTGTVQHTSYMRSVIALCELTNDNPNLSSYSVGMLSFIRSNGVHAPVFAMVSMQKVYNQTYPKYHILSALQYTAQVIRACTFVYNGIKYGGLEIWFDDGLYQNIEFNGVTNFPMFGVDYYNEQTSAAVIPEINDSLNFSEPVVSGIPFYNGYEIATSKPTPWIDATLQNGWTGVINYRKNQIGQIEIKGLITPGTLNQGTIIAQLPSGYYSNRDIVIPATRHSDGTTRFGILLNDTGAICIYGTDVTAGTSYDINCVGVLD